LRVSLAFHFSCQIVNQTCFVVIIIIACSSLHKVERDYKELSATLLLLLFYIILDFINFSAFLIYNYYNSFTITNQSSAAWLLPL